MGAWGYKSYENDHCTGELCRLAKVPTDEEIAQTLERVFSPSMQFYDNDERREIRLGCIIYFLENNIQPVIPVEYMKEAEACARSLKRDITYLARWNSPKARRIQLTIERMMLVMAQIRDA